MSKEKETVETIDQANDQKPITVARQDFIDAMINIINTAGLPAFVLLDVIKDVEMELARQAKAQYEQEKEEYEKNRKGG